MLYEMYLPSSRVNWISNMTGQYNYIPPHILEWGHTHTHSVAYLS
jgi:hypothetical protein